MTRGSGLRFVKGHGTENDFILLPDLDARLDLDAYLVRALCDRRSGVGADGVLRVVPVDLDPAGAALDGEHVRWFMDYRNADGSLAEMCGNGIRVFARYLVDAGLELPGRLHIATRGGVRAVDVALTGDVTAEMGVATKLPDAKVSTEGVRYAGAGWSMGNPHLVVFDAPLDRLALTEPPTVDPASAFPDGVNVEFVEPLGDTYLRMRVWERGVGETRSCGTGACAAAVALMAARGERGRYDVDVPGGRLGVAWRPDGSVWLTGPAVLVAEGEVDARSLRH